MGGAAGLNKEDGSGIVKVYERLASVTLDGKEWSQKPQKYHAKSLAALREKYARVADKSALDALLARAGCLTGLGT